jgi:dihydrodipicolinate reductase
MVDSIKELVTDKEESNGNGQEDLLANYGDSGKDSEESIGGIDLMRGIRISNQQEVAFLRRLQRLWMNHSSRYHTR